MKEIIDLRKPREKHFENNDGTITAYVYKEDIHYFSDGTYKEIDNTLIEEDDYYINKNNVFHTKFPKSDNYLYEIEKDNHFLKIKTNHTFKMEKEENSIIYKSEKLDIKYDIISSKVKENIILKEKGNYNISFTLETDLKLTLVNNTIEAKYNDEIVFILERPFMYDNNKEQNNNVKYILEENTLTLDLDNEWLSSEERVYPVVIDPTVINGNNTGEDDIYDTYISTKEPDKNYNSSYLYMGVKVIKDEEGNETSREKARTFLKFILPEIPTGYTITNATVFMHSCTSYLDYYLCRQRISVHEVSASWEESYPTWNNMKDNYNKRIETYFRFEDTLNKNYISFELTNLVKEWYSGKPNNGIMIKQNDEDSTEKTCMYSFYAKENDRYIVGTEPDNLEAKRPYLLITYKNQEGVVSYMDYTNVDYNNGVTYINNRNGNAVHTFSLNGTTSNKYPTSIGLVYSTSDVVASRNYKLTLEEEIIKNDDNELVYVDGTGARYYFYKLGETYNDEDGLNLKISLVESSYELSDTNGNKKIFTLINNKHLLTKLIDNENNEINITYENNKITKVTDASNEVIDINYRDNQIIVKTKENTTNVNITNNKISSIETRIGTNSFIYNDKNLITKIIDTNGLAHSYEYYDTVPYKMKKVTEIGLNEKQGKHFSFEYGSNTTSIIDNNNKKVVYSFNNNGMTKSRALYTSDSKRLEDIYVDNINYYPNNLPNNSLRNKMSSMTPSTKYVNNLLTNNNFGFNDASKCNFTLDGPVIEVTDTDNYLKVKNNDKIIFNINESSYYTLSFDLDNSCDVKIYSKKNDIETLQDSLEVKDNIKRVNLTGYFEENDEMVLTFNTTNESLRLDNIQLEKGMVSNGVNLVNNSSFTRDLESWEVKGDYEIVTLETGEKAIKLNGNPDKELTLQQLITGKGKKGDTYEVSFWYKNEGVKYGMGVGSDGCQVTVNMKYVNNEYGRCVDLSPLEIDNKEWQYFRAPFTADWDYESIRLIIFSLHEANSLYITNVTVTKDTRSTYYAYDEEGRLIQSTNLSNNSTSLKYDNNNKLISMFNPKGNNFTYEYDNIKTDRIRKGISPTGISNEIKYDEHGNPIRTLINNVNPDNEIKEGHKYEIRLKGTDKFLNINFKTTIIDLIEDTCNHQYFEIEKEVIDGVNYYRFKVGYKYVNVVTDMVRLMNVKSENSLFILDKCDNGSYNIVPKSQYTKNFSYTDDNLKLTDKNKEKSENQFYFEDIETPLFIENKSYYTPDGKFVTCVEDALGKKTYYDINKKTGLTKSTTNPKGDKTLYNYNYKNQLISVGNKEKTVYYNYNEQDLLSNIKTGTKDYSFTYDDFLNKKEVKINNNLLVTNDYEENNGKLLKSTYGNGYEISYEYDNFDRVSKTKQDNREFNYYYDSKGNLAKIIGDKEKYTYFYDLSGKLSKYIYNNFSIDYEYDHNDNITDCKVSLDNEVFQNINYEYNKDDSIIKVTVDNNIVNYNYDYLGRIQNKNINNYLNIEYTYYTNGHKTSLVLKSMKIDNDTYEYIYDNLYNITEIYLNKTLTNSYTYDTLNQLIEEKDYIYNKEHIYVYDKEGNIKIKKEINLETNELLKTDTYEYNNQSWEDQLTRFNNETITYDEIGNPLTIGNKTLTWKNGRQLSTYTDNNLNITYDYDINGIRKSKTINGIKTEYLVANNNILIEKRMSDVIYYIYDANEIIGLKHNNNIYYYKKNYQGDIIGIYNLNYNQIVSYEYDSWGKVLSIKDNLGNEITDTSNIGLINPYRYRSYYYDEETKLYYLNSRYYNPEWGRFINADGIIGTTDEVLIYNLYMYCMNNPIKMLDIKGDFPVILGYELGKKIVYGIIVLGIALYASSSHTAGEISIPNPFEKWKKPDINDVFDKPKDITMESIDTILIPPSNIHQEYFPINPLDFNPTGLRRKIYPGTKNGMIIEWVDNNNIRIFEWDEDFANGAHYHALKVEWKGKHLGPHYFPGMPVPEPWNTVYFGGISIR